MYSRRRLLTIQQVSKQLGVPKPTLRFWEKVLTGILTPNRSEGGQRRYTETDVRIVASIKRLKDQGKSLSDIAVLLRKEDGGEGKSARVDEVDVLANRIAEAVKFEVYQFLKNADS